MMVQEVRDYAIFLVDTFGRVVSWNTGAERAFGYAAAEMLGDTPDVLCGADDPIAAASVFQQAFDRGRHEVESWLRRKDGSRFWGLCTVTRLDNGRPLGYGVVVRDLTERRAQAQRLADSEHRLRAALEAGRMGTWVWNIGEDVSHWNAREYELLGLPVGDGLVDTAVFFSRVHPDDLNPLLAAIAEAVEGGYEFRHEFRVVWQDGTVRWLAGVGLAHRDEATGRPARMFGVNYDITDRKANEAKLAASERLFRALAEHGTDGLVLATRSAETTFVSPAVTTILGYTPDEFRRLAPADMHHPDDLARVWAEMRDACGSPGTPVRVVHRMRHAGGGWRTIESTVTDWSDDPAVGAIVINYRDISDREALRAVARESEARLADAAKHEAVARIAGGVAHDFNNMLTVVNGTADLALMTAAPNDPRREAFEAIRDAGGRAAGLAAQLLAYARRSPPAPQVLNPAAAVAGAEWVLRRLLGPDVRLLLRLDPAVRAVRIDPTQFEQVLVNLAVNARDAMPGGGEFALMVRNTDRPVGDAGGPGRFVELLAADTGCGIPADVRARIFEPFFTTKEPGKGTGLGLATVLRVVREAGGTVSVDSAVGSGTTFRVLLPAVVGASGVQPSPLPRGTETVLVIDNDPAARELAKAGLEPLGYRVLTAGSLAAAAVMVDAAGERVDLLVKFPLPAESGGGRLADALRAKNPGLRVLYVCGSATDVPAGAAAVFKPYTPSALAAAVRAALDGPAG